jgi:hypothetical protein
MLRGHFPYRSAEINFSSGRNLEHETSESKLVRCSTSRLSGFDLHDSLSSLRCNQPTGAALTAY